ncbi:nitrous oxide-stimulated promoter family protein [Parvimonas sp. G1425]|uniref:nitrous oxide-stimulated promoter family protein n=1 Tax=Parvimonas sp. G1425 TaxID=3387694 RepID=UPI0039E5E060
MKNNIEKKRDREKKVITEMVKLYCKKNHKNDKLCDECRDVLNYSLNRIDNCKYMDTKTFCSNCKKPCYSPKMKEKIKQIMKFSGPRMLFHHPLLVIYHIISGFKK